MTFFGTDSKLIPSVLCGLLILGFSRSAIAEEPLENRIVIMQSSADGMIQDLEYMIKDLARQGKTWREYIEPNLEIFLDGVDTKKPIRVDIHFDEEQGEFYRICFPYTNLKDFLNNIDASGITSELKAKNLYQLGDAFSGWLKTEFNYAIFVPETKKGSVSGTVEDPLIALKPLIDAGYDTSMLMMHDKAGMKQRRLNFETIEKNVLPGIKKKSTESLDEFQLRKVLAENQLATFKQFYVEIKYLEAGWTTNIEKNEGTGALTLSALEGTELDGALKQIAESKSRFVNIPESKDFAVSGRLVFPIIKSRQLQYQTLYNALLPVLLSKIEKKEDLSAEQKKATKSATEKIITMLIQGLDLGVVDGFVEMKRANQDDPKSTYELIAGIRANKGDDAKEIIKLLPQVDDSIQVKMNVETVGDLQIHEIIFSKSLLPISNSIFGLPCKVHVATSDNLLAIAIGDNANAWLKETLELINKSEEKPVIEFVKFKAHLKPFADSIGEREPSKDLKEPAKTIREKFIEAFDETKYESPDDYFEMIDKLEDGQVKGSMKIEPGLFRFFGLLVADFAKNNL